jgi:biotin carboxylase
MPMTLQREELVLVGFSRTLLTPLAEVLPPGSVVVIDEPDIAARRDVGRLAAEFPAVSRVLLWEYQRPGAMADLLRAEPALKTARGVLPGIEYAVTAAADLAAGIGVPGAGVQAGLIFRDKARQRAAAAAAGIRNPRWAMADTADEAAAFLAAAGGRCVIKPSARQASLGVRFVSTPQEAAAALEQARSATEVLLEPDRGIRSATLIEEALTGAEYSVELLVRAGTPVFANVTAKQVLAGDFPVELGHLVPAPVPAALTAELTDSTARLARACGFGSGVLHCEWIVDAAGPAFVECAARMPGDEVGTLISLAYGFPMTRAYLEVLLGSAPALPSTATGGAAVRFLLAVPGVIQAIDGAAEAERAPGVRAVRVGVHPGDTMRQVTSSWDRAGYVLATAPDAGQAGARAAAAASLIDIRTVP